jgi:hypothetical protein
MRRYNLLHKIFAMVFAVAVVFTVSVKEVHYLFSFHETHEHCENHLHPADHHAECAVCKFDLSVCDDQLFLNAISVPQFFSPQIICLYTSPAISGQSIFTSLRGPPVFA